MTHVLYLLNKGSLILFIPRFFFPYTLPTINFLGLKILLRLKTYQPTLTYMENFI